MSENMKATKKDYDGLIALFARVRMEVSRRVYCGFICNAIGRDMIANGRRKEHGVALNIVRHGLGFEATYDAWLNLQYGRWPTYAELRAGRLAWIDSIIAQAKRERRLAP